MANPADAVDGNINTRAVASSDGATPQLTIDLGKPGMFNMVVIDHGRNELGFASEVRVQTSLDGRVFTNRYSASGARRVSSFLLLTPVLARYVRLEAVAPGQSPWSLAEIHIQ